MTAFLLSQPVLLAMVLLGGVAALAALLLGVAGRFLKVTEDPRLSEIERALPGANCGGCGLPGCSGYARAVLESGAAPDLCAPGGKASAEAIGRIMGRAPTLREPQVARLRCHGHLGACRPRYRYAGIQTCKAAVLQNGGNRACAFACTGLGDCVAVCPFDAMVMDDNGLPQIDEAKCTGCNLCVAACPKKVLELQAVSRKVFLHCASTDKARDVTRVCATGCTACNLCVKKCPQNALTLKNNLPQWDWSLCNQCGLCAEVCPRSIIFLDGKPVPRPAKAAATLPEA